KTFLVEKVVQSAVLKIASMFNPAGAVAQLILAAWNVYCWLRDNAQRILGLVQSVVDSVDDLADGVDHRLDQAQDALGVVAQPAVDVPGRQDELGDRACRIEHRGD